MMSVRRICIVLVALFPILFSSCSKHDTKIVPKPVSVESGVGFFNINDRTSIVCSDSSLIKTATLFSEEQAKVSGLSLPVSVGNPKRGSINLALTTSLAPEEYMLEVRRGGIELTGGSAAGVFYGFQTLKQLMDDGRVASVKVLDKPHFAYRGTHLDVARHFFTVEEVKTYIDILAAHKINNFHWHLTDDQGWRVEIKRYPGLTEKGAFRKQTVVGLHSPTNHNYDGIPHGGYYTQEEIRDIVQYAADRFITVVPEIDLPGHMMAALTAYPDLGCTGGPYELWCRWGISEDVLCAGNEKTYIFLENILDEVMDLFPSEYIHIGGDECPKTVWEKCPKCQAKIRSLGLEDKGKHKAEHFLQNYVMARVEKYLNDNGRKIIGWDEILDGSATKSATVMVWRDQQNGVTAARRGNNIILTPRFYCYFDYCQTSEPEKEPLCVTKRYLSIRQVYRLDPYDRIMLHEKERVLGVQANVWTEYIADFKQVQHMLLPRLAALSETAWSYDRKDLYEDFEIRAKAVLPKLYDQYGYHYAPYFFDGIE